MFDHILDKLIGLCCLCFDD